MKFTATKHVAAQIAATVAQIGLQGTEELSASIEKWATIGITLLQAVLAIMAHFRTPAGQRSSAFNTRAAARIRTTPALTTTAR